MAGKALIVLAHPAETSLSRLFAQIAHDDLTARGFDCDLLDLHARGFQPVLTADERRRYYAPDSSWPEIAEHADMLTQAGVLVLCFPTWWFGMPAILKGWIDRVFAPGVAFDHANDFGPIKPRLTGLKHVVVVTTLGSPWWVDRLVMRRPVRRILKTAIFGLCAPQAKFHMVSLHAAEKPDQARIDAFSGRLRRILSIIR